MKAMEELVKNDAVCVERRTRIESTSYGSLIGGRRFDVRITANGTGWDMVIFGRTKRDNLIRVLNRPMIR